MASVIWIDWPKENLPNTFYTSPLLLAGLGCIQASSEIHALRWVGLAIFAFWILVLMLEVLSKIAPIFKRLLNILLFIPRIFIRLYVWFVKLFIRRAVLEIVRGPEEHLGDSFVLRKQPNDDDYWGRTLDLKSLEKFEFSVDPSSDYWRFGFKFSKDSDFPSGRVSPGHPLFHLGRDNQSSGLKVTYYDTRGEAILNESIKRGYRNTPIRLVLDHHNAHLRVRVIDSTGRKNTLFEHEYDIDDHAFAQAFAWGDGNDYELRMSYAIQER